MHEYGEGRAVALLAVLMPRLHHLVLIASSMQIQRGKVWEHLSCTNVYQMVDRVGERPTTKMNNLVAFVLRTGVLNINEECMQEMHCLVGGPSPPAVYLGKHWQDHL